MITLLRSWLCVAFGLIATVPAWGVCVIPHHFDVDIGTYLSTTSAEAIAAATASLRDSGGELCTEYPFSMKIAVKENGDEIESRETEATGEHTMSATASASVGNCYIGNTRARLYITIFGIGLIDVLADQDGSEECWMGPPPPPVEPDPGSCPGAPGCGSPIILAIGADDYRLTSFDHGVQFDLRNDGEPVQVAWTRLGSEVAFLALDRNGNAAIDNGSELFGNYTPLRSGILADNGFVALAELDDDGNGVIDRHDDAWSALLLWTDRNHDGRTTADEIIPINASIVTGLETDYTLSRRADRWGNLFYYKSRFRIRGARRIQQRPYYDVFLRIAPP